MGLTTIVGDYDAIVIPLLADKALVASFLPPNLHDDLCSNAVVNGVLGLSVPEDKHPLLLVLGQQNKCGPSLLPGKMTFQEAKLEVPLIKHSTTGSDAPHTFKSILIFDNRLMSSSSHHIVGLRSRLHTFTPSRYSSADETEYRIADVLSFSPLAASGDSASASPESKLDPLELAPEAVKRLLSLPWFGERTGKTVSQFIFDWDTATRPLEPISGHLELNLNSLTLSQSSPSGNEGSGGSRQTGIHDVSACRFRARFRTP